MGLSPAQNGLGNTPTEERGELPAPPPTDDADAPVANPVTPAAAPTDGAAAAGDALLSGQTEAPVPLSLSAPDVAEATTGDWTPDGALALASVVFAGTWLRRDAAHKADEKRSHAVETPARPKVS